MKHALKQTLVVGAPVAVALLGFVTTVEAQTLDACKLVSAAEASQLDGHQLSLKRHEANATFATCVYEGAKQNPMDIPPVHVEISYGSWPDAGTAHTRFQARVQPGGRPMQNTTVNPVAHLGDEAAIKRTPSLQINSIDVRKGNAVVSLGVKPLVSDSALAAVARTALSRLP